MLDLNEYIVIKSIGSGAFGCTLLVKNIKTDTLYALKIVKDDIEREITYGKLLNKELNSPFIIKQFESLRIDGELPFKLRSAISKGCAELSNDWMLENWKGTFNIVLMEYLSGGPLLYATKKLGYIHGNLGKSRELTKQFIFSLLWTLNESYTKLGFVHSDIKPDNIIWKLNYKSPINFKGKYEFQPIFNQIPVLIDFGSSLMDFDHNERLSEDGIYFRGTFVYAPPETIATLLTKEREIEKSLANDIWALAITLIESVVFDFEMGPSMRRDLLTDAEEEFTNLITDEWFPGVHMSGYLALLLLRCGKLISTFNPTREQHKPYTIYETEYPDASFNELETLFDPSTEINDSFYRAIDDLETNVDINDAYNYIKQWDPLLVKFLGKLLVWNPRDRTHNLDSLFNDPYFDSYKWK